MNTIRTISRYLPRVSQPAMSLPRLNHHTMVAHRGACRPQGANNPATPSQVDPGRPSLASPISPLTDLSLSPSSVDIRLQRPCGRLCDVLPPWRLSLTLVLLPPSLSHTRSPPRGRPRCRSTLGPRKTHGVFQCLRHRHNVQKPPSSPVVLRLENSHPVFDFGPDTRSKTAQPIITLSCTTLYSHSRPKGSHFLFASVLTGSQTQLSTGPVLFVPQDTFFLGTGHEVAPLPVRKLVETEQEDPEIGDRADHLLRYPKAAGTRGTKPAFVPCMLRKRTVWLDVALDPGVHGLKYFQRTRLHPSSTPASGH
ncbi:hypothetical protein B0T17DRAFT_338504 [Bombardia bombarda]|uniref:Uncharacterized protein n=1 Tax=Bombardia bombarda TaxID=252184 RepID=A0AA39WN18_9PEZI|nr:hypothetical protein B0T17DRAFT_338504 [Bombardia bombarda]